MDHFSDQLRARGFRMTPQRMAILRILSDSSCHLLPLEIYQRAQAVIPGITEATVYRTLTFLHEQGLVLAAHIGNGQLTYEIAGHDHHHLVCRKCGHTHQIEHRDLAPLYAHFQESTGYQIDIVHVTFFGLCPGCQHKK